MSSPVSQEYPDSKALGGEHIENTGSTLFHWCNSYQQPITPLNGYVLPPNERFGPIPYDINFCFPYHFESLTSPSVKLVPFLPRLLARPFFNHIMRHPTDLQYMRMPHPRSVDELATWLELEYRRNPSRNVFAVMFADTGSEIPTLGGDVSWTFGAVMSLEECDPQHLSAEIGMTINLRRHAHRARHKSRTYQRSIPTSDAMLAASLLIRYCFNLPTDSPPGLGLRRLGVHSQTDNIIVHRLMSRLGFRLESRKKWCRVVDPEKGKQGNGRPIREGDVSGLPGVDALYFTMCWNDWESCGRERAQLILDMKCEARL